MVDENEPIVPLQQPQADDYSDANWEPEPIDAGPGEYPLFITVTSDLTALLLRLPHQ